MKKFYTLTILTLALIIHLNAQTWTTITTPSTAGVAQMVVANNNLYLATRDGVFSSTDGTIWNNSSTGMTPAAGYYFNENIYNYNNVFYSGTSGSTLYKSVDFGANWTEIPGAKEQYTSPAFTAVYVKGDTIIIGLSKSLGIRKSYDGGTTWTSTGSAAGFPEVVSRDIVELNGAIYVKTLKGIFKSTDMAASFTQLAGGLPTFSGSVGALTVSNGVLISTIYLLGTYISSDEGVTWTQISTAGGITSSNGRSLNVEGGKVYLGCASGIIFSSSDNGTTWTDITGTGIGILDQMSCFATFNGNLYAGSSNALYKTPLSTSVSENVQEENTFSIYPNPVNNLLTISNKKEFNNASIKIYNITGNLLLEKIIDGEKQQTIDMAFLSDGLYIIEVSQNYIISRQKVIKK